MRGQLDLEAAARAVDTCIGKPLGLSVDEAAYAIIQVANARMAEPSDWYPSSEAAPNTSP